MRRWQRGLVIGKFRPPHKGHGYLIQTALEQVDHLTVILCEHQDDQIPANLRAGWLRETFPGLDLRVWPCDGYDPDDSHLWADLTRRWLGSAPDVVFTSEGYGEAYTHYLECDHVCLDRARKTVPISATQILAQPLAYLDYLEPCVRAYFVARVCIVGAESTGKTTLARRLAARYQTAWVPEYGRLYTDGLLPSSEATWVTPDFVHIAQVQQSMEDMLARHANRLLFCDTDAFTTWLWHERYVKSNAAAVRALADARRYALYLLTADDIPWEDDGTRDHPEERPWFQQRFREELAASGRPYVLISGSAEARFTTATAAIDRLLAAGGLLVPAWR